MTAADGGSHFDRDGLHLAVRDTGRGRQPVVLQHGLCASSSQTAELFLDDPRWRWLTLECRGHGESEAGDRSGFSIAAFADDLAALIEARRLPPVVAGGISMGAASPCGSPCGGPTSCAASCWRGPPG